MFKTILAVAAFLLAGTAGMLRAENTGGGASNPGLSPPQGQQQSPAGQVGNGASDDGGSIPLGSLGPKKKSKSLSKGGNNSDDGGEGIHLGSLGPKGKSKSLGKGGNNSDDGGEGIHLGSLGPKGRSKSLSKGGNNSASDDESIHLGSLGGNPKRTGKDLTKGGKNTHQGFTKFTGGVKTGKEGKGLTKNGFQKTNNLNGFSKNTMGGAGGVQQLPAAAK